MELLDSEHTRVGIDSFFFFGGGEGREGGGAGTVIVLDFFGSDAFDYLVDGLSILSYRLQIPKLRRILIKSHTPFHLLLMLRRDLIMHLHSTTLIHIYDPVAFLITTLDL